MALLRSGTFFYDPSASTEYPVRFRFPMTWSYLLEPNEIGKSERNTATVVPMLFTPRVAPEPGLISRPTAAPDRRKVHQGPPKSKDQSKQWEMVIPKRPQPGTKLVQAAAPQPEPAAAPKPVADPPVAPVPSRVFSEPFAGRAAKSAGFPWKWILIAAAVVGGVFSVWGMRPAPKAASVSMPVAPGARWVRERALFVVGSKEERHLILYRGTEQASDFRAEFDWKPDANGVGLIFRCSDRGDYQAVRIGIASERPSLNLFEEHFTVLGGIETKHERKLIPWTSTSTPIHVALDGMGFVFMLYVQGSRFDYWTDNRLRKGDVGFYEDRDEQPSVDLVRFTFPNHAMPDYTGAVSRITEALP